MQELFHAHDVSILESSAISSCYSFFFFELHQLSGAIVFLLVTYGQACAKSTIQQLFLLIENQIISYLHLSLRFIWSLSSVGQ